MSTTVPLITIGITCFNAAETIGRAISSAAAQSWPNLEIIVVDDCSSDGSVEEIKSAMQSDRRIHLICPSENGGPGAARASIVAAAKGDFVAFFDDDDESDPERVLMQYETLARYEETHGDVPAACYASGVRLYPNGYEMEIQAIGSRPEIPAGEEVADYLLFYGKKEGVFYGAGTPTCALMARTSTIRDLGGFDPAFRRVEDIDFAVRLAIAGGHFIGCQEPLYTQYATKGSDKSAKMNYQAEMQLMHKHKNYLQSKGKYRYACNWFRFRYYHFSGKRIFAIAALLRAWLENPVLVTRHFLKTAPNRFFHQQKMNKHR